MKNIYLNSGITRAIKHLMLIAILLVGNSFLSMGQLEKAFTQRTSSYTPTQVIYHIQGDFTMIGNTNLTPANYNNNNPNYYSDNNTDMVVVDMDGDITTTNSSMATLTFVSENGAVQSCSNIIYAGLYWTGRCATSVPAATRRQIKVKGPGQGSYQSFTANANDILYPDEPHDGHMYAAYVEVTDLVKQYGWGQYWVADMAVTAGHTDGTGNYGGWGMVVVYENSKMKWRDVTIFDGYAYVAGSITANFNIPVSGFHTAQSNDVNMKLGVIAGEGDMGITGDYFQIMNQSSQWVSLNDGCNQTNNFFNSSICNGGTTRNPNLVNNTGIDVHMFNIPNTGNAIIGNNQTSTTFNYGTTGDTYIIFNIDMAVDAYVGQPEALDAVQSINGVTYVPGNPLIALPGNPIQCKVDIYNKGNEAISNAQVVIPIPYASTYVSCSGVVNYSPSPNNYYFDPTLGANGSIVWNLGTLPYPPTLPTPGNENTILGTLTFTLQATTNCTILTNQNCPPEIDINGTLSGTGVSSGTVFTNLPFIQGFQTGTCIGIPIYTPIQIPINISNYNCNQTPQEFTFCNVNSPIPITAVSGNFPSGSRFYSYPPYPVTINSTEYTISNPFPASSGTYIAIPPGTSSCYFQFTITVTNITDVPIVSSVPVNYCQGATAAPLTATKSNPSYTLYYYNSLNGQPTGLPQLSITPSTTTTGTFEYFVAQGYTGSCISLNTVPIYVYVYALPTVTASSNSPVCLGGTLHLMSGSGFASYSWTGPISSIPPVQNPDISGATPATAGNYTVTVATSHGCTASNYVSVSTYTALTLTPSITNASCGDNNGHASVTVSGGQSYSYLWAPGGATGSSIGPVAAGFYAVTVTDGSGCSASTHVIIGQSGDVTGTCTVGNITCYGAHNGSINVTGSGGVGTYQYSIDGGITFSTTGYFSNLAPGDYNVVVKDQSTPNPCEYFTTVTITSPTQIQVKASFDAIKCHGGTTDVNVTATGGVPDYQYQVNNENYQSTGLFSGLLAGTYTFTVKDNSINRCEVSITITISEPSLLQATATAGTIACYGGSTTVTVSAVTGSGTPPYSGYGTVLVVAGGPYNYVITDNNGCTASASITVTQPEKSFYASSTAGTITCPFNQITTVDVEGNDGTPPYLGAGSFPEEAGTYTYFVIDNNGNGCTASTTITVSTGNMLATSVSPGTITCFGGTTSVTVFVSGGVLPYFVDGFEIPNNGNSVIFNSVSAGTYPIHIVSDAAYCYINTDEIYIPQPTQLTVSATEGTIACHGGTTTVTVTAGTGSGTPPYTYSMDGGPGQSSGIFTAGAYPQPHVFTVTDDNLCTATTSVTISEPDQLNIDMSSKSETCDMSNGAATATVSGGTLPFSYQWSNNETTPTISGLTQGIYFVTVTDHNGCPGIASVTISEISPPSATASNSGPVCSGSVLYLYGGGPGSGAGYVWSGPSFSSTDKDPIITNVTLAAAGDYYVTVTDNNGCSATAKTTVVVNPNPAPPESAGDVTVCANQVPVSLVGNVPSGINVNWYDAPVGGNLLLANSATYSASVTGTYYNDAVNPVTGCVSITRTPTTLTVNKLPIVNAYSVSGCAGTAIALSGSPAGGTFSQANPYTGPSTNYTYTYTDGNLCTNTSAEATITVNPLPAVTAVNVSGCAGISIVLSGSPAGGTFSEANPYTGPSTTYTYTYTDGNLCTNTSAPATITVNKLPIVTAANVSGCAGTAITLSGSPAGGTFTQANPYTGPSTTYTYTYTDGNLCTNTSAEATITVNPLPAVTAVNVSVCEGASIALSGSPAGGTFSQANPYTGPSTNYTYTFTDGNLCTNTSSAATITVIPNMPVSAQISADPGSSVCAGTSITFTATSDNGGTSPVYQWMVNGNNVGTNSTTYTTNALINGDIVTVSVISNATGCISPTTALSNSITITVFPLPVVTANDVSGCAGTSITLLGSPAGGTFSQANPYTGTSTTYTYTYTDGNGCTNTSALASITVYTLPTVTAANVSGCAGTSIALSGSPAGGTFSQPNPFYGTGTTSTYTYTYTDNHGCTSTSAPATITVYPLPSVTANNVHGCAGTAITLSGSPAGGTYSKANPYSGAGTTYTYTYTDGHSCTSISLPATITVYALPTVTASNVSGCAGSSIALSGSPAGGTYNQPNPYTGTTSTTYTYRYTDANGCSNTSAPATITVSPAATVSITETATGAFCQEIHLTANVSGTGNQFIWSTSGTTQSISVTSPGTYSVTVSNPGGCAAIGTINVSMNTPSMLSSYVMLACAKLNLTGSIVHSGGLGALEPTYGQVNVTTHGTVTATGTFAEAPVIYVDPSSQVTHKITGLPNVTLPAFEKETYTSSNTANIPNNTTVFLTDTLYQQVLVGTNSTVIFTQPVINIVCGMSIGSNSIVKFMHCGKVRIGYVSGSKCGGGGSGCGGGCSSCSVNGIVMDDCSTLNPDDVSMIFYLNGNMTTGGHCYASGVFYAAKTSGEKCGGGGGGGQSTSDCGLDHQLSIGSSVLSKCHTTNTCPMQRGTYKGLYIFENIDVACNNDIYQGPICGNCPNYPPVTFACPSNMTLCYDNSTFNLRSLYPQAIPGIVSITNNQPAVFPVGTTTVVWTVIDNHGSVSVCKQKVTRAGQTAVTIGQSGMFCDNGVELDANITGVPAVSYNWSNGATTPSIVTETTGVYIVTVSNSFGCSVTDTVTVDLNAQNIISSYVMYTQTHVCMNQTTVKSGGVGVIKNPCGQIDIHASSLITASGTFAKAIQIYVDGSSNILNKYCAPASAYLPPFEANPYTGVISVSVPDNVTISLNDTLYKEVKIGKNAKVTFTKPVVNIQCALTIGDGSTVRFARCSVMRIKGGICGGQLINLNPDSVSVIFYIQNNVSFNKGTHACGIFYLGNCAAPGYQINTTDSRTVRANIFKGIFIANEIISNQNTYWFLYNNCGSCISNKDMDVTQPVITNNVVLQTYPNPFSEKTTLLFIVPTDNHVKLEVYDLTGKLVRTLFNANADKDKEYTVVFDGSGLTTGIYLYKLTTNDNVYTGKMMLNKE